MVHTQRAHDEKEGLRAGCAHITTATINEMVQICSALGYKVVTGPELETEWYNFDALNVPKGHPAREMWDTFWIRGSKKNLLRTHTSAVQIRFMEQHKPPIRIIAPGKVFRNEATDATHEAQFFQLEGLCVDTDITLSDMKGFLNELLTALFGTDIDVRYRPSFFPFTEPSLEVDMKRKGSSEWIEILGCGMVHPLVLARIGIDTNMYQGFAFGIGIDRVAILRHGIDDIRHLYSGDLRFVNQFFV